MAATVQLRGKLQLFSFEPTQKSETCHGSSRCSELFAITKFILSDSANTIHEMACSECLIVINGGRFWSRSVHRLKPQNSWSDHWLKFVSLSTHFFSYGYELLFSSVVRFPRFAPIHIQYYLHGLSRLAFVLPFSSRFHFPSLFIFWLGSTLFDLYCLSLLVAKTIDR